MNAPVDVLAVLDVVIGGIVQDRVAERRGHRESLIAVRAAFAELIEALRPLANLDLRPGGFDRLANEQVVYARDNTCITTGDVRRAVAALARAQGETA